MNQGLYGFPSTIGIAASNIVSITEFDASGTYSIPSNAETLEILLIGGGGGGAGGAGANAAAASGGAAGSGGSVVYINSLVVQDLPTMTLNISIGTGGLGGGSGLNSVARQPTAGGAGGTSTITMRSIPGFLIRALGGAGGSVITNGTAPTALGSAGGAGRSSSIGFLQTTNTSGQNGGISTVPMPSHVVFDARNNNGAAGGSTTTATSAATGGSIEIATTNNNTNSPIAYHINLPLVGSAIGITAVYGGAINAGPTLGAGQNAQYMIGTSLKVFGGGLGGAGGGASNSATVTLGGGNGGNGWRGGGGGGGGASRNNAVPGGSGGNGGNGYCCIIARA